MDPDAGTFEGRQLLQGYELQVTWDGSFLGLRLYRMETTGDTTLLGEDAGEFSYTPPVTKTVKVTYARTGTDNVFNVYVEDVFSFTATDSDDLFTPGAYVGFQNNNGVDYEGEPFEPALILTRFCAHAEVIEPI